MTVNLPPKLITPLNFILKSWFCIDFDSFIVSGYLLETESFFENLILRIVVILMYKIGVCINMLHTFSILCRYQRETFMRYFIV